MAVTITIPVKGDLTARIPHQIEAALVSANAAAFDACLDNVYADYPQNRPLASVTVCDGTITYSYTIAPLFTARRLLQLCRQVGISHVTVTTTSDAVYDGLIKEFDRYTLIAVINEKGA